ncbi:MAG: biotin--[acetyl-CoA-carboxylase] ligase [Treponema sp.]|jgi:BirA family biotin operon repressor/biotin-[acetyl-CoA-carboxylase] ligase|nr:biotin--[acetyl-CoA-carboxylase] ligase [Treponema sp.]
MIYSNLKKRLDIKNPFNAPVFYAESVSSTMDVSHDLERENAPHGTVVVADFQEKGRGRAGRLWRGRGGENLLFTVLLRFQGFSAIPIALSLRAGLAAASAVEDFAALFCGVGETRNLFCTVKWPNDLMLDSKKIAGILVESDGKSVFIGIGVNVGQTEFPAELREKAGSLALKIGSASALKSARFRLLELVLARLRRELTAKDWRERLLDRLYRRGEAARFIAGRADSGSVVEGVLSGVGEDGALLILPHGAEVPSVFVTGELDVY